LTRLDRSEIRIDVRSLDCAFHSYQRGWEEAFAVLVDVTKLATAESEDKLGDIFLTERALLWVWGLLVHNTCATQLKACKIANTPFSGVLVHSKSVTFERCPFI